MSLLGWLVTVIVACVTVIYIRRRWRYYKETANERAFFAARVKKAYKDQARKYGA